MAIHEVMYYLFKNGKSEGQVGFLYNKNPNGTSNKEEKLGKLRDVYTVNRGYVLSEVYDREL